MYSHYRVKSLVICGGLLSILFIATWISVMNSSITSMYNRLSTNDINESIDAPLTAASTYSNIRVAIYYEPNKTAPAYTGGFGGTIHNDTTVLEEILGTQDFQISLLTTAQITNHELITANYDVFILCDQYPRTEILNLIVDFWRGGGGLITFDGSSLFLAYKGILPREAIGSTGHGTYWYYTAYNCRFESEHPISVGYQEDQVIPVHVGNFFRWNWTALSGTSIAADMTRIASSEDDPNTALILAYDPSDRGGRIVTIGHDLVTVSTSELNQLIFNSIAWVCPHPKARILYDLSHNPLHGIDIYDPNCTSAGNYFELVRDTWVSNKYCVDKFYPDNSAGITTEILAQYDILWLNLIQYNFSAAEILDVRSWVENGGSLLICGDNPNPSLHPYYYIINNITETWGLSINLTTSPSGLYTERLSPHLLTEGITQITAASPGVVNYHSPAYPIWNSSNHQPLVCVVEPGTGKVILIADIEVLSNNRLLNYASNVRFAENIMNWFSSNEAEVLIYEDGYFGANLHRTPACLALNQFGIKYVFTRSFDVFNLTLNSKDWALVVFDNPGENSDSYASELLGYVQSGGKLIFSSWRADRTAFQPFMQYIGLQIDTVYASPQTIQSSISHQIFRYPHLFSEFTPGGPNHGYSYEAISVVCYSNATALASLTPTFGITETMITQSLSGRVFYNGLLFDSYTDDGDNSYTGDNYELMVNEIAYFFSIPDSPIITTPSQIIIDAIEIEWLPVLIATGYKVYINGSTAGNVVNPTFTFNLTEAGEYQITVTALNHIGESAPSAPLSLILIVPETTGFPTDVSDFIDNLLQNWYLPTGGLVIGFLLGALIIGLAKRKGKRK